MSLLLKEVAFKQSSPANFCVSSVYQCFQQNHPVKAKNLLVNAGNVLFCKVPTC